MGLYSKIFGTYSERQIKKQMQQINMTEQLASTYAKLSDAEMAERTLKFKKEIADGKELDAILPDAFALVREAADRVLANVRSKYSSYADFFCIRDGLRR